MKVQSNGEGLSTLISYSGRGVPILVDFDKEKVDKITISAEKGILLAKIDDTKPAKTITRQSPEVVHWRDNENVDMTKENKEVDTVTVIAFKGEKVVEQKNIPIMLNEEWNYIAMQCDAYNLDWDGKPVEEN